MSVVTVITDTTLYPVYTDKNDLMTDLTTLLESRWGDTAFLRHIINRLSNTNTDTDIASNDDARHDD